MTVDLFRYHDLTQRLTAFAVNGGAYLRGDREDVQVVDAEPLLMPDEREHARVGGVLRLFGSRTTSAHDRTPSLGLVLEAGGAMVVTSHRLILLAVNGVSQLGRTGNSEIHTFALPWDLVDSISVPARKSFTDRVAGARTIELFSALTGTMLHLIPAKEAEIRGRAQRIDEDGVMRILADAAVRHRMTVSPEREQPRLQRLLGGPYRMVDGEFVAEITIPDQPVPVHLVGRLAAGPGAKAKAAALLLIDDE